MLTTSYKKLMLKSLIWKNKDKEPVINEEKQKNIIADLQLNKLMSLMSKEPVIKMTSQIFLSSITSDIENIKYRQCILKDFICREEIMDILESLVVKLDEMNSLHKILKSELRVPKAMLRLKKLELYYSVMKGLEEVFAIEKKSNLSKEFIVIAEEIKTVNEQNRLEQLEKDIREAKNIISKVKSIDVGANLDFKSDVREAIVFSLNDFKYEKSNMIDKVMMNDSDLFSKTSIVTEIDISGSAPLLLVKNELYKEFETLINSDLHIIENIINNYEEIITSEVLKYRDEICLYFGAVRLYKFMMSLNMPVSFPVSCRHGAELESLYSLNMAYERMVCEDKERFKIIKNNIFIGNSEEVMLITGPNNGGKTVLLESLAVAQLLFQNGIMIPASNGKMSVYSKVYSHFPKDEDISISAGRLGEEANRISRILKRSDKNTLVLFNEPYITTSPTEGLDILVLTLMKFKQVGTMVYLVTHYLDILDSIDSRINIASYVLEYSNGVKTYKALNEEPMAYCHALDIARKYGIDAEGILKLIENRKEEAEEK